MLRSGLIFTCAPRTQEDDGDKRFHYKKPSLGFYFFDFLAAKQFRNFIFFIQNQRTIVFGEIDKIKINSQNFGNKRYELENLLEKRALTQPINCRRRCIHSRNHLNDSAPARHTVAAADCCSYGCCC